MLRRQATIGRATPAGSSRVERLDPFALPLRFEATDLTADERVRVVELHRERVVLRRALRGIKMALNLPVRAYRGVAIRMEPPAGETAGAVAVVLEHSDPACDAAAADRDLEPLLGLTDLPVGQRCNGSEPSRHQPCTPHVALPKVSLSLLSRG
jgi:hypothetical protein